MRALRAPGKEAPWGLEHQGQACWAPRGVEEERLRLRREAQAGEEKETREEVKMEEKGGYLKKGQGRDEERR